MARTKTVEVPIKSEYYAVVSFDGTVEESRVAASEAFSVLAKKALEPGWAGGTYTLETAAGEVRVECDLVDPDEGTARAAQWSDDEDDGDVEN